MQWVGVVTGIDCGHGIVFISICTRDGSHWCANVENTLQMQSIGAELKLSAGYNNSAIPPQQLTICVELKDICAELVLLAAFDVNQSKQLPLQTFLHVKNILPCVLSAALDVQIPH